MLVTTTDLLLTIYQTHYKNVIDYYYKALLTCLLTSLQNVGDYLQSVIDLLTDFITECY
jgi:hypothetical protein